MRTILTGTMIVLTLAVLTTGCRKTEVQGPSGSKLTLVQPGDVTITRGETATVEIKLRRERTEGDIAISFDNLPAGVTAVDGDTKIVGDEATYILKAADDAAMVSGHVAKVTAKTSSGMGVTETFKITIKEKT